MLQYLIHKLEAFTSLSPDDRSALLAFDAVRRKIGPRQDLICEGDDPTHINLILEGWACRYKQLEDGRRQIIALLLPGDLCDTHIYLLRAMDHSICALTSLNYAQVSRSSLGDVTSRQPRIAQALMWETLVTAAIQREWTVNLGQRDAVERLGHLLCEIFHRLRIVGLTEGDSCPFPITQIDVGNALGISSVHVNRCVRFLRAEGLIEITRRRLTIKDLPRLQAASTFDPAYLHFNHDGGHLSSNRADDPPHV